MRTFFRLVFLLIGIIATPALQASVTIDEIILIDSTRVGRTLYNYTYEVRVTNTAPVQLENVTAYLSLTDVPPAADTIVNPIVDPIDPVDPAFDTRNAVDPVDFVVVNGTTLLDDTVEIGTIGAGETIISTDTIVLQQDRTFLLDPDTLVWEVGFDATVTLSGIVTDQVIPFADVEVLINRIESGRPVVESGRPVVEQRSGTADADGHYSIDVVFVSDADFVDITAFGVGDLDFVELNSIAGSAGSLLDAAEPGPVSVDGSDYNPLNVTHVSTALAALSIDENGGVAFTNDADLAAAQAQVDNEDLLLAAAVIKTVIDNENIDLPPGVTDTADLLENPDVFNDFAEMLEEEFPEQFEAALDETIVDLSVEYVAAEVPETLYLSLVRQNQLASDANVFTFNQDGSAMHIGSLGETTVAAWTVDPDGNIVVDLSNPPVSENFPAVEVPPGSGNFEQVRALTSITQFRVVRVAVGIDTDQVLLGSTTLTTFPDNAGILPDEIVVTEPGPQNAFLAFDAEGIKPFSNEELFGRTIALTYFHTGNDTANFIAEQGADFLSFAPDGAGTTQRRQFGFSWNVDAEGRLTVTFDNGDSTQYARYARTDENVIGLGVAVGRYGLDGVIAVDHVDVLVTDDGFQPGDLANRKLRNSIAITDPEELLAETEFQIFDFNFLPDGSGCRATDSGVSAFDWLLNPQGYMVLQVPMGDPPVPFLQRAWQPAAGVTGVLGSRYWLIENFELADDFDNPVFGDPTTVPGRTNAYEDIGTIAGNTPPDAVDDNAATAADTTVIIDVLGNDSDAEDDLFFVTSIGPTSLGGSVGFATGTNNQGALEYGPPSGVTGVTDTFTYELTDSSCNVSSMATVSVMIGPANEAPSVSIEEPNDGIEVPAGTGLTFSGTAIDLEDGDLSQDISWFSSIDGPLGSGASIMATLSPGPHNVTASVIDSAGAPGSDSIVVVVTTDNEAPVADAGDPQSVNTGDTVLLDGSGSFDPDEDAITYLWDLISMPVDSSANLDDPTAQTPSFVADRAGPYIARLVVSDGLLDSAPSDVTVTAVSDGIDPTTITLTPATALIDTRDEISMLLTLDQPAPAAGLDVTLQSSSAIVDVPPMVSLEAGTTSVNFLATSGIDPGNSTITASSGDLTPDTSNIGVEVREFSLISPLVGIDRTVEAIVALERPAPAGGATLELSVGDPLVAMLSDSSLTIPAGQSQGTFEITGGTTIAATTVTADGTVDGYETQTLGINVTDRLIDLPPNVEALVGQVTQVQILISPDAAPPGGVDIAVASNDPAVVEVLTPIVNIPEGSFGAFAQVMANTQDDSVQITASNEAFAPDTETVNTGAALNILETSETTGSGEAATVYFEIRGEIDPGSEGGDVQIDLTSDNPACVLANSPAFLLDGNEFGSTTLGYAGELPVPCTATVTAFNPVFGSDSLTVTIDDTVAIGTVSLGSGAAQNRLGASLQTQGFASLSNAAHGGVLVQIESSDPDLMLLSWDSDSPGVPVLETYLADGSTNIPAYFLQGVRESLGAATLTVSAPGFTENVLPIEVVSPAFRLVQLNADTNPLANDDPFYVQYWVLSSGGNLLQQQVISGAGPLDITFTSSDPGVGAFTTQTQVATSPVTVTAAIGTFNSPTTLAAGGLVFDVLDTGTTTVSATAAGFDAGYAESSLLIESTAPLITVSTSAAQNRLGASLKQQANVTLGGANHGGVTVRVTSSDPGMLTLTPGSGASGAEFLDIDFADGETSKNFFIQGVREETGLATVTATEAQFADGSMEITVVEPVLRLVGLNATTNALAADDSFYVQWWIRNTSGNLLQQQVISTEGVLPVTFTSSNPAVGAFTTLTQTTISPLTTDGEIDTFNTPTTFAGGGVAFDALGGGETTVSATAPGFDDSYSESSLLVTSTDAPITISSGASQNRLGASLQTQGTVTLGGGNHGGVTVTLASSDAGVLRVANNSTDPGSASIELDFADGETTKSYWAQGVRGATGSTTLTASQAQFSDGTLDIEVIEPVLRIVNLSASSNSLAADDPFYVQFWTRNSSGNLQQQQRVSGEGSLPITFTSSDPLVGVFSSDTQTSISPLTLNAAVNLFNTPTSVATGGVAYDALGDGITTVSATAPGFDPAYGESSLQITSATPDIAITTSASQNRLGASLQTLATVTLSGSDHGGVFVFVGTNDPSVLRLSPDASTVGVTDIVLEFNDGESSKSFYIQGVRGSTGTATIEAFEKSVFDSGQVDVEVVEPVARIVSLGTATNNLAADDPFYVQFWVRNTSGNLAQQQAVSAEGPLPLTFTSSMPSVGALTTLTQTTVSPVTIDGLVGTFNSPTSVAAGGVAYDAVGIGETEISVTAPGFDAAYSESTFLVDSVQAALQVNAGASLGRIGASLQTSGSVTLTGPEHGGVTVRITSSNPDVLLIAPDATTFGSAFIDIEVPDGQGAASFVAQGVRGETGSDIQILASSAQFADGSTLIEVVQPVTRIINLTGSIGSNASDDPFQVQFWIINDSSNLVQQQSVSAQGVLPVTFTSSNAAAAALTTADQVSTSPVTINAAVGSFGTPSSVATGGVSLDPIAAGTTTVTASAPGFQDNSLGNANTSQEVVVTEDGGNFADPAPIKDDFVVIRGADQRALSETNRRNSSR